MTAPGTGPTPLLLVAFKAMRILGSSLSGSSLPKAVSVVICAAFYAVCITSLAALSSGCSGLGFELRVNKLRFGYSGLTVEVETSTGPVVTTSAVSTNRSADNQVR
jgi:hypothetical protein